MTRRGVPCFAAEVLGTFALVFVGTGAIVIDDATGGQVTHVGVASGIAIGGVVGLEAMFAGPICGASMNPARSLAPALVSGTLAHLWLYLTAPVLGAAVAVACWRVVYAPAVPAAAVLEEVTA